MEMLMSKMVYNRSRQDTSGGYVKTLENAQQRRIAQSTAVAKTGSEQGMFQAGSSQSSHVERETFENKVLDCVDSGLGSLGQTAGKTMYWYMEYTFGLRREEIPRRPEAFVRSMRQMLGSGAEVLERSIIKELEQVFKISSGSRALDEIVQEVSRWSKTSQSRGRYSRIGQSA